MQEQAKTQNYKWWKGSGKVLGQDKQQALEVIVAFTHADCQSQEKCSWETFCTRSLFFFF